MHPLNYKKEDLDKILNQKIEIKYKNYQREIETIKGLLIRYDLTNLGDILPHTLTLDLGREERTINIFDIEHLKLINE